MPRPDMPSNLGVRLELRGAALEPDPAVLEHVAAIGNRECERNPPLRDQERQPRRLEALERNEGGSRELRREPVVGSSSIRTRAATSAASHRWRLPAAADVAAARPDARRADDGARAEARASRLHCARGPQDDGADAPDRGAAGSARTLGSDRGYVLENGRIRLEGSPAEPRGEPRGSTGISGRGMSRRLDGFDPGAKVPALPASERA